MKANFLSPRAGMGGDFFVDGFQRPEPELVEAVRQGIEAHKRNVRERNAARIAEILEYLRRPDANGD